MSHDKDCVMKSVLQLGTPVRLGDTVYQLSEAKYHGRRDDGVFVSIYIDGMAEAGVAKQIMTDMADEATRLRMAGHTVL